MAVPGVRNDGSVRMDGFFSACHAGEKASISVLYRSEYDDGLSSAWIRY